MPWLPMAYLPTPTLNDLDSHCVPFLTCLSDISEVYDWALIPDRKDLDLIASRCRGTFAARQAELLAANTQGYGVFVTVNESDGEGFTDNNIVSLRAVFVDDDKADPPVTHRTLTVVPSITVQVSRGRQHNYFALQEGEDPSDFTSMQKALAKLLGTDPKISNLSRVMRVPGFYHNKREPELVKLIQVEDVGYTVQELVDAFKIEVPTPAKAKANKAPSGTAPEDERVHRARAYLLAMGPAIQGRGGDEHTFKAASTLVRGFNLPDEVALALLVEWNEKCEPPWTLADLGTKVANARAYGKEEFGSKLGTPSWKLNLKDGPGRVQVPAWTADPFSSDKGPLVHFHGKDDDWSQIQPTPQVIADAAEQLIHYAEMAVVAQPQFGHKFYTITPENIAVPTPRSLLIASVRNICKAAMGGLAPTPETFKSAEQHFLAMPRKPETIVPLRWKGEQQLALHEIMPPREGDWSAHQEFLSRCSCPDTVKAWTWSCFLNEEDTGREALFFWGDGNDGKSEWCRALITYLGPVATAAEIIKGENRFELANLLNKRLVYFGDFRNPKPIHSKIMREIISGAHLFFEKKGVDGESAYFHPRCLFSTNVEPRVSLSNKAEMTRIRRINISPLEGNKGDRTWPKRLLDQMPAFLYECRKVYDHMVTDGKDIPVTEACHAALYGGQQAMAEDFDSLFERFEVTGDPKDIVAAKSISEVMDRARYDRWRKTDAFAWLRGLGANNKAGEVYFQARLAGGGNCRIWRGIKELNPSAMSSTRVEEIPA